MRINTTLDKMKKILSEVDFKDLPVFYNIIQDFESKNFSISKCKSRLNVAVNIYNTNHKQSANIINLLEEYFNSDSRIKKIKLTHGENSEYLNLYTTKLKNRPKPTTPFSIFDINYWLKNGLTIDEANEKVSLIQKTNANKRSKKSYNNFNKKIKWSKHYWISKGYNEEEAVILAKPYLTLNDEISMIARHGEIQGKLFYKQRCLNFKTTMEERWHLRKSAGYVSVESKKFFIPLYKMCRKIGIPREWFYIGVDGSKEFFIRHEGIKNSGRFYDFALPKLNIIVEYNGVFWHPRDINEWKNPWISYDDAMLIEVEKKRLCEKRGYDLYIVWSDDNLEQQILKLFELIKEKFNDAR
jgi:hypothetical protein